MLYLGGHFIGITREMIQTHRRNIIQCQNFLHNLDNFQVIRNNNVSCRYSTPGTFELNHKVDQGSYASFRHGVIDTGTHATDGAVAFQVQQSG